jgi:primary-amine oxidase
MCHPLEPINDQDIKKAVNIFKNSDSGKGHLIFSNIQLVEPPKEFFHGASLEKQFPRIVNICGIRTDSNVAGFLATINLTEQKVVDCHDLPDDAHPPLNDDDGDLSDSIIFNDPGCIKVFEEYGVSKEDIKAGKLVNETWPGSGYVHPSVPKGHRALRATLFYKNRPEDNIYARPLHNLIIHVDLTSKKVAAIENHGAIPLRDHVPHDHHDKELLKTRNTVLKPLRIIQPEGPSFIVNGHHIKWDHWSLRVSMHPIHGVVLHQVTYNERPILYRAALADMVVPYGDPDPMHCWKQVLDASEYNIGTLCNSLENGCDCLGVIHYFDACHVKGDGSPETIKNAICLHEEDCGVAWKHTTKPPNETSVSRRNRRLVISSFFTVDNYDYGFYWYLYLDGTIEMEIKLTGVVGISSLLEGSKDEKHAPLISHNLASPVHQHLLCFRLDWQLDGGPCRLYEEEVEPVPRGKENPHDNLFEIKTRLLSTEHEAMRVSKSENARCWEVASSFKKNGLGNNCAYKILPGPTAYLLPHADSVVAKRATFAMYNLWATPFSSNEFSAAGDHTLMNEGNAGLSKYTSENRPILDCDLVTWNTIGVTHVPRPEDWPIMPVATCKLSLVPSGFFDYNPVMDLPKNYNVKQA